MNKRITSTRRAYEKQDNQIEQQSFIIKEA